MIMKIFISYSFTADFCNVWKKGFFFDYAIALF